MERMDGYYGLETFSCANSVGYLMRRASNLIRGRLEAVFADREITFTQWVVLMQVRHRQVRTAADISRDIGYDSGALARMMDQLAHRGLIARQRCCNDRRVVELSLTAAGDQMLEALTPAVVDGLNALLVGFRRDEVDSLLELLTRFVAQFPTTRDSGP
jgi:DNA-binding MarR family transcriptional regulator